MDSLLHIIATYGLWFVFISVLLDQGGLPVPSYPAIIVTAALASSRGHPLLPILLVAIAAAVFADLLWFAGGRRYGASLLRLVCKVSLSPESCIGQTRRVYGRWGTPSLIVAKYVPGFAAVATTLAGETGTKLRRFLLYDTLGAALWAAGAVALGAVFRDAVDAVLARLADLGHAALIVLLVVVGLFIAGKWWRRRQFLLQIRMTRIAPDELRALLASAQRPTVLDVRTLDRRNATGWIPASIHAPDVIGLDLPREAEIVTYCDCPHDASAALAARKLKELGYARVRPLAGGVIAWRDAGHPLIEMRPADEIRAETGEFSGEGYDR
jgi:membrane protein DedA with SNARE-associated domain/rhodanese-related sulfurtransferase